MRAVTFQSMVRTSSPGWYWRTSEKAMPRPLKTEWYWPASMSATTLRVRISSLRMRRMRSRASTDGSRLGGWALRHFHAVEDALDELLRGELLRLGLVAEADTVA